jgi:hypothetical protein
MGGKQHGFSDNELTSSNKQTKREMFLTETDLVVSWQALIDLIEPHYPKASKIRRQAFLSAGHDAAGPSPAAVVLAQRPVDGRP